MRFLNRPGEKGWSLDPVDVDLLRELTPLVKALTPLILGVLIVLLIGILAWKGQLANAGITALMGTIFKAIWQRLS